LGKNKNMRIVLISMFIFIIGSGLFAQQHSYEYLSNQYCAELKKLNIKSLPKDKIFSEINKISKRIRQENADTIEYIISNILRQNDTLTHMEAVEVYTKRYLHHVIFHCPAHLTLGRAYTIMP